MEILALCLTDVTHSVAKTNLAPIAGLKTQVWITTTQDLEDPSMVACVTAATLYLSFAAHQVGHLNRAWQSWGTVTLVASRTTLWSSRTRGPWWGRWSLGRFT